MCCLSVGRSVTHEFCPEVFSKTAKFHGLGMCPTPPHVGSEGAQWGSFALIPLLYGVKIQI